MSQHRKFLSLVFIGLFLNSYPGKVHARNYFHDVKTYYKMVVRVGLVLTSALYYPSWLQKRVKKSYSSWQSYDVNKILKPNSPKTVKIVTEPLKIATINAYSFPFFPKLLEPRIVHQKGRWDRFKGFLDSKVDSLDFVAFQEFWGPDHTFPLKQYLKDKGFYVAMLEGNVLLPFGLDQGLLIASKHPIERVLGSTYQASGGVDALANKGILAAKVSVGEAKYWIVNTHMQSGKKDIWEKQKKQLIQRIQKEELTKADHLILLGDFNKPYHFESAEDTARKNSDFENFLKEIGGKIHKKTKHKENHTNFAQPDTQCKEDSAKVTDLIIFKDFETTRKLEITDLQVDRACVEGDQRFTDHAYVEASFRSNIKNLCLASG